MTPSGGWVPCNARWWPQIADTLTASGLPWPDDAIRMDLRWWADQERMGLATRPGRPTLERRWSVGHSVARRLMRDEDGWADPAHPRSDSDRSQSGSGADSRRTAIGQRSDMLEAVAARESDDAGQSSEADRSAAGSSLDSDRTATGPTRVVDTVTTTDTDRRTTTETTSTNAPPVPARDLRGIPEALHPALHAILDRAAIERRMPRTAETCARWGGIEGDMIRGAVLLQHIRQMPLPPAPEVPDAGQPQPTTPDQPSPEACQAAMDPVVPPSGPDRGAGASSTGSLGGRGWPALAERLPADHPRGLAGLEPAVHCGPDGPAEPVLGVGAPRPAHQHGPGGVSDHPSRRVGGAHAQEPQPSAPNVTPAQPAGPTPRPAQAPDAPGDGAAGGARLPVAGHGPAVDVADAAVRAAGPAQVGASGDPDRAARRVAPPRWDDSDAWHDAAGLYAAIGASLQPEAMPRAVTPSDPAGRDLGAGLEAHGARYVERLRAILAALQGQPAPAAAHEVARLARDLWGPESPSKALASIRRPAPAATVAAVDAAIAEGAPWVERPPERRVQSNNGLPTPEALARAMARRGMTRGEVIDAQ